MTNVSRRLFARLATVFGLVGLLALSTSSAWADIETYSLSIGNSGINGTPGPYATVTVDRTSSTTATLTFDALSGFFFTGGAAAVGANFASAVTVGTITGTPSQAYTASGSQQFDGFGDQNTTINAPNGAFSKRSSEISFTVTLNSGTWTTVADLLTNNSDGHQVAADIGVCNAGCTAFSSTGYATADGGGTISQVPEPTMISVLTGLGGLLAFIAFRVRRPRVEQV